MVSSTNLNDTFPGGGGTRSHSTRCLSALPRPVGECDPPATTAW